MLLVKRAYTVKKCQLPRYAGLRLEYKHYLSAIPKLTSVYTSVSVKFPRPDTF